MGNAQSLEEPRRVPNKLSKPRAPNRLSLGAVESSSTSLRPTHGKHLQYSNSYLVDGPPLPTVEEVEPEVPAVGAHTPPPAEKASPTTNPPVRRHSLDQGPADACSASNSSPVTSPIPSRTVSTHSLRAVRRASFGAAASSPDLTLLRTNSSRKRNLLQPIVRTPSIPSQSRRSSINYDLSTYEVQRLVGFEEVERLSSPVLDSETKSGIDEVSEATGKTTHSQEPVAAPTGRTQSETSLHAPIRRRSLVHTPGVATRSSTVTASTDHHPSKAHARKSLQPTTPPASRRNSLETKKPRHQSFPNCAIEFDPIGDRASTPCEQEFKQLGVIKFGSLRITNGAPTGSPVRELEETKLCPSNPEYRPSKDPRGDGHSTRDKSPLRGSIDDDCLEMPLRGPRAPPVIPVVESGIDQPPNPELQITSKHNEHDAQLFDEDDQADDVGTVEHVDVQTEEIHAVTTGPDLDQSITHSGISRSDSGGASNASSDNSRSPLPTVDSGYSSNLSIRSKHSSQGIVHPREPVDYQLSDSTSSETLDDDDASPSTDITVPSPSTEEVKSIFPVASPDQLSDSANEEHRPSQQPRGPISSRQSIRFPSFRKSRKSDTQLPTVTVTKQRCPEQLYESMTPAAELPSRSPPALGGVKRLGKIQRMLSGGGKKTLPAIYPVHEIIDTIPCVPSHVEERLHVHNGAFPTAPKRLALRTQPSLDSLNTILSVGSQDNTEERNSKRNSRISLGLVQGQNDSGSLRRRSWQDLTETFAAVANMVPQRKTDNAKLIRRKPVGSTVKVPRKTQPRDDETLSDTPLDEGDLIVSMNSAQKSAGKSAFDQALTALEDDIAGLPVRNTADSQPGMRRGVIRSHDTRPPYLSSSPSMPELAGTRTLKSPPPVSMNTRTQGKRPNARLLRRQSIPEEESGHQQLQGAFPCIQRQQSVPKSATQFASCSDRHSGVGDSSDSSCYADAPYPQSWSAVQGASMKTHENSYFARKPRARPLFPPPMQGQQFERCTESNRLDNLPEPRGRVRGHSLPAPPYRVLHSYNSPAYRGVPIWN